MSYIPGGGGSGEFPLRYCVRRKHVINGIGRPTNHYYFPMQHVSMAAMEDDWNGKDIPKTGADLTRETVNVPFVGAAGIKGWSTSQLFLTDASGTLFGAFPYEEPCSFTTAHLIYWPSGAASTGSSFVLYSDVNNYRMDMRFNREAGGVNVYGELMMNQQNFVWGSQLLGTSNAARASAVLTSNKWHIVSYAYDAAVGYARMRCQPLDGSAASWGDHYVGIPGPQTGKPIQVRFGKNSSGWLEPTAIVCDAYMAIGDCVGAFMDQTPLPTAIGDIAEDNWNTMEVGHASHTVLSQFASTFDATPKARMSRVPGDTSLGPAFIGVIGANGMTTPPNASIISAVTPKTRDLVDATAKATWFQYTLTGDPGNTFFDVTWNGAITRVFVEVTSA